MSRENVELVRRVYDAAARRDAGTVFACYHPDVELDASRIPLGNLVGRPVRRGHDGVESFFRELNEAWENLEYDVGEVFDAGDQHVISVVTRRGRGKASGIEVQLTVALVWTIREAKIVQLTWFPTRVEALEAVGLSA